MIPGTSVAIYYYNIFKGILLDNSVITDWSNKINQTSVLDVPKNKGVKCAAVE
jgi:hypothetical protein